MEKSLQIVHRSTLSALIALGSVHPGTRLISSASLTYFFAYDIILSLASSQSRCLIKIMSYIGTAANALTSSVTWMNPCDTQSTLSGRRAAAITGTRVTPTPQTQVQGGLCVVFSISQTTCLWSLERSAFIPCQLGHRSTLLAPKTTAQVQGAQYPGHHCRSSLASRRHLSSPGICKPHPSPPWTGKLS